MTPGQKVQILNYPGDGLALSEAARKEVGFALSRCRFRQGARRMGWDGKVDAGCKLGAASSPLVLAPTGSYSRGVRCYSCSSR